MDGVLGLFKMGNAILFPELMADLISDDTNMLSFSFSGQNWPAGSHCDDP